MRAALQLQHRGQQPLGIGMLRIVEDRVDRAALDDAAELHHHHLLGDLGDDAHVMGDEHHRHAVAGLQLLDQLEDLGLGGDVERRGRLVGDQQLGLAGQRHGRHGALAHAAGELEGIAVEALRAAAECAPAPAPRPPAPAPRPWRHGGAGGSPRRSDGRWYAPGSGSTSAPGRSWRCRGRGWRAPRARADRAWRYRRPVAGPRGRRCRGAGSRRSMMRPGRGTICRIERAVTLLPLPLSPTTQSVLPRFRLKLDLLAPP